MNPKWLTGGLIVLCCVALVVPDAGADGRRRRRNNQRDSRERRLAREDAERIGFVFREPEHEGAKTPGGGGGGPEADGKQAEGLERLAWLVGDWTAEERDEQGEPVRYSLENRWDKGRLRSRQTIRTKDGLFSTFTLVYRWDPKEEEVRVTGTGSKGGSVEGTAQVEAELVTVELVGADRGGKEVDFTLELEMTDEDALLQNQPNDKPLEWRRKRAAAR